MYSSLDEVFDKILEPIIIGLRVVNAVEAAIS